MTISSEAPVAAVGRGSVALELDAIARARARGQLPRLGAPRDRSHCGFSTGFADRGPADASGGSYFFTRASATPAPGCLELRDAGHAGGRGEAWSSGMVGIWVG